MSLSTILDRLRETVRPAEVCPLCVDRLPRRERALAAELLELLDRRGDAAARALLDARQLDPVHRLSALHLLALQRARPDLPEAARLADQQEYVALQRGGPDLAGWLASADRNRGVVALRMRQPEVALDWFTRAFERERAPEHLANVLVALIACGDIARGRELVVAGRARWPASFAAELDGAIARDADLAALR